MDEHQVSEIVCSQSLQNGTVFFILTYWEYNISTLFYLCTCNVFLYQDYILFVISKLIDLNDILFCQLLDWIIIFAIDDFLIKISLVFFYEMNNAFIICTCSFSSLPQAPVSLARFLVTIFPRQAGPCLGHELLRLPRLSRLVYVYILYHSRMCADLSGIVHD